MGVRVYKGVIMEPRYTGFLPGAHALDGYGSGGFRFASMSIGLDLALPSGIFAWSAAVPSNLRGLARTGLPGATREH